MSDTAPAPKVRPWLRLLLAGSLALNLLVVGLVAGAAWRFAGPGHDRGPPPTGVALIRALPPADRQALRDRIRAEAPPDTDRRAEAESLARALEAKPFDRDALAAEVARQTHARGSFQSILLKVWLDHVAAMDDDRRAAYADRLVDLSRRGTAERR